MTSLSKTELQKLIRSHNIYYERFNKLELDIERAARSLINKYVEAFYEFYPEEREQKWYGVKYSSEYRWIFCADYFKVAIEYDHITVEIWERGVRGNSDEYRSSLTVDDIFLTEEGRETLVNQWKEKELEKIKQKRKQAEIESAIKIEKLEQELKKLKGE